MSLDGGKLTITPAGLRTEETEGGEHRKVLIAPNGSVQEIGTQTHISGLSLSDKYVALQFENQKLRRALRKVGAAFHDWRERALQYEVERDHYREQVRAGKDEEL